MAEDLIITANTKEERYKEIIPQLQALVNGEDDLIANLGNVCAALKFGMNFFWVGFYFVKNDELVLGPFQGPVACTRIKKGKGVCGTAWQTNKIIIVDDVEKFEGHIACSSLSKSEIVLPVYNKNNEFVGVLDADSEELATFDSIDEKYLQEMLMLIKSHF